MDLADARLKASVVVPYEDARRSATEIERAPATATSRRCCC